MLKTQNRRETDPLKNVKTKEITENMELDKSPFFKKIITPWYDSGTACWLLIFWAISILIFALTGLKVAISNPVFNRYMWFPLTLIILLSILIISIIIRMTIRNIKE